MNLKYINTLWAGLLIGLLTCFVGYAIISLVFETLESLHLIDEVTMGSASHRQRTILLLSICCNIIGIQFFNKRKYANTQRGVAVLSVLAAGVWIFYFKDSLFNEM